MTQLNLKRPLAFFDLETTGINQATDRIVEIGMLKLMPNHQRMAKTMRINPEMPIPAEASAVHGIYDADVANAPTFKQAAHEIARFLEGCDLAGFNSARFDLPMLVEEFLRAGVAFKPETRRHIDVQRIFHQMEKRTLEAAYQFYCNKNLDDAHSAEADTQATFEVLLGQLERYGELQNDIDFLHDFSSDGEFVDVARRMVYVEGKEVFNFGKYKGQLVEKVFQREPQYYDWMMSSNFPLHTKKKLTEIKIRLKQNQYS